MPSAQTVFVSEYFCAMFTVKCVERWKPLLQDKNSSRVCYFLFLFFWTVWQMAAAQTQNILDVYSCRSSVAWDITQCHYLVNKNYGKMQKECVKAHLKT